MFKNYVRIAFRALLKNKVYSLVNILGLTVGLTCCMLITLYVRHELSYDNFQKNKDRIYQVGTAFTGLGDNLALPNTPARVGELIRASFPEVESCARLGTLYGEDKTLLQYLPVGGQAVSIYEKGFLADAAFFGIFTYHFTEGNAPTALNRPNTIVLSAEVATRLFGDKPALNRVVRVKSEFNGDHDYQVTGVMARDSRPSHIVSGFFISMNGGGMEEFIKKQGSNLALNYFFYTYLLLKPGTDPAQLERKAAAQVQKNAEQDFKAAGFKARPFLVPLTSIHLDKRVENNITPGGSTTYLYIFVSVALFTLVIACVNFMNLTTARSSKRSAEVGIRKVLGARRNTLVYQFLGEALMMSFLALILACLFTWLLAPFFRSVTRININLSLHESAPVYSAFIGVAILTGLLAGSYPAFYLSSFKPVKVLKGKMANSASATTLRKGLVIFQFIISIVLIVGSVIITRQMAFLRSADLGFDKDQQLIVPLHSPAAKNAYIPLHQQLMQRPQIKAVGASIFYPGINAVSDNNFYRDGKGRQDVKDLKMNYVDEHFLQTLNLKKAAGRFFSKEFYTADTSANAVVINEAAVKALGFAGNEQAVGQKLHTSVQNQQVDYHVVGVVKDFHFEDLHVAIAPYCFILNNPPQYNYMILHITDTDARNVLQSLQILWRQLVTDEPFEYTFLDQEFQKNYEAENRMSSIVSAFTLIAVSISCMGLFGLATFTAEQRLREIGIRKVLGASALSIVGLLSKEYIKLISISILIALPLAMILMHQWLSSFPYKAPMNWIVIAIGILVVFITALLTVSLRTWGAASANPIKSIRTE